jgi:hypothetical protein
MDRLGASKTCGGDPLLRVEVAGPVGVDTGKSRSQIVFWSESPFSQACFKDCISRFLL